MKLYRIDYVLEFRARNGCSVWTDQTRVKHFIPAHTAEDALTVFEFQNRNRDSRNSDSCVQPSVLACVEP